VLINCLGHIAEYASEERVIQEVCLWRGHQLGNHGLFHQVLHELRARMPQRFIQIILSQVKKYDLNKFRYSGMTRNDTELCLLWSSMADSGKI
jgi:hypothetical protein